MVFLRITALKLSNFRSFGPDETRINLPDFSVLIGANGSGKTAVMQALARIFSSDPKDRTVVRSDFHVPVGTSPEDMEHASFYIEAIIGFPELDTDEGGEANKTVPPLFSQMVVESEGEQPYVRIRLTAEWNQADTPDGEIDSRLDFITVPESETDDVEDRVELRGHDRSHIRMIYVPAVRDPGAQLKHQSGAILWRVLNAIAWSETLPADIKKTVKTINDSFAREKGISSLQEVVGKEWGEYHGDARFSQAEFGFGDSDLRDFLRRIEVSFRPTFEDKGYSIDQLGDGLRSLFYLSLVSSLLELESNLRDDASANELGLSFERLSPPALTILGVEEPENHLAPNRLGRVVENLLRTAAQANAQVVISSHTPSLLHRVDPQDIRHLRLDSETQTTLVSSIVLPSATAEAYMYVKEAVRAYPELYFARLVVLGEGDSEEIVLPRVIESMSGSLDRSEVCVVPLGGRHVNYFWKLLNELQIPHITLLDLDRERKGGGWGRIKYALQELRSVGALRLPHRFTNKVGVGTLTKSLLEEMHTRDPLDVAGLERWVRRLRKFNVFFSAPLDLDFMMLVAFQESYQASFTDGTGPRLPSKAKSPTKYEERIQAAVSRVLKEGGGDGSTYSDAERELFVWYTYLFLGRGKPTTHLLALTNMETADFQTNLPEPLKKLGNRIAKLLKGE